MKNDIVSKTGIMSKRPGQMSAVELKQWKRDSFERAKAYLFSIGQPLVYHRADGRAVAEYADGSVVLIQ